MIPHRKAFLTWKKVSAAIMEGNLAAHVVGGMIILYHPVGEDYQNNILGVMEIRVSPQGGEIKQIWAKKGYGPLLYLLAAEWALPKGLIPSQIKGQISPAAKRIWEEFYRGKGRDLVKARPYRDSPHPEPFLNIRIQPKTKRLQRLQGKDREFLHNDPFGERETMLVEKADSLLRLKMSEIY